MPFTADRARLYREQHPERVAASKRCYRLKRRLARGLPAVKPPAPWQPTLTARAVACVVRQGYACPLCSQPFDAQPTTRGQAACWNTGGSAVVHLRCWERARARERAAAKGQAPLTTLGEIRQRVRDQVAAAVGTPCLVCRQNLGQVSDVRPHGTEGGRHYWCSPTA